MKPPYEWDQEADLVALIGGQVQESLTLDYTAGGALVNTDPKKDEVSKDVSAFANAAGGVVIYGMVEEHRLPTHLDGVDPAVITREWLDQVIGSRIQPRIDGVRIMPIDLPTQAPGR